MPASRTSSTGSAHWPRRVRASFSRTERTLSERLSGRTSRIGSGSRRRCRPIERRLSADRRPPGDKEFMMPTTQHGSERSQLVSLADEDGVKEILSTTIMSLWDVVNELTRLRPSKRERYRVAIFGSARAEPGTFVYEEVKRAAAAFAAMGCDIVTGGGPGL